MPNTVPYLSSDTALVEHWRRRIGTQGFKIGICWQGSAAKIDIGRSFPLALFKGLGALPGVRLISLQKGAGEAQIATMPAGMKLEVLGKDFDAGPDAFLDTAAVMQSLDLIISSDTGVAHLAGALGRPTWVALKRVPDWRWLMDRTDSPWYPTTRLFRQTVAGDWGAVFARIEDELRSLLESSGPRASRALMNPSARDARGPEERQPPTPRVPVSWGELLDKMTILEIKNVRLADPAARANVAKELALLTAEVEGTLALSGAEGLAGNAALAALKGRLRLVNETLWQVEDSIRAKEAKRVFDAEFVELARAVYLRNDERGALKKQINNLLHSELVEEKSYSRY